MTKASAAVGHQIMATFSSSNGTLVQIVSWIVSMNCLCCAWELPPSVISVMKTFLGKTVQMLRDCAFLKLNQQNSKVLINMDLCQCAMVHVALIFLLGMKRTGRECPREIFSQS